MNRLMRETAGISREASKKIDDGTCGAGGFGSIDVLRNVSVNLPGAPECVGRSPADGGAAHV
jgi:hypothetical protein